MSMGACRRHGEGTVAWRVLSEDNSTLESFCHLMSSDMQFSFQGGAQEGTATYAHNGVTGSAVFPTTRSGWLVLAINGPVHHQRREEAKSKKTYHGRYLWGTWASLYERVVKTEFGRRRTTTNAQLILIADHVGPHSDSFDR